MAIKTGEYKTCKTCDKKFYVQKYLLKKDYGKFCSLECRRHNKNTKNKMSLIKKGKPTWNKGKTKKTDKRLDYYRPTLFKSQGKCELKEIVRHSFFYRQWRSDVFTRDNFTCQLCGIKSRKLEADHIKPFAIILKEYKITTLEEALICEELWNINNGRTLCKDCHKKTDTYLLGTKYLI